MLENTFAHIPGIGEAIEGRLWKRGFLSWQDVLEKKDVRLPPALKQAVALSRQHLDDGDIAYFARTLPARLLWRLFPDFRQRTAYLDIETTGLGGPSDYITTIAVYDGRTVKCYVHGRNMADFAGDIAAYELLVTYNGKCFDIPFIESKLGVRLRQAHLDLRYLLRSLGYKGGLKGCERQLGISRGDLDGVDGYFAVLLWQEYLHSRRQSALETLLAYNIEDVINLERLLVKAYNMSLCLTPFAGILDLPEEACKADIPFKPDLNLVCDIRTRFMPA